MLGRKKFSNYLRTPKPSFCQHSAHRELNIGVQPVSYRPSTCTSTDRGEPKRPEIQTMPEVNNLTPFAALSLFAVNKRGEDVLVIVVAGRYVLPKAGRPTTGPLAIHAEQRLPPLADVYWGEPGASSVRYEGQGCYFRPGTDIYLTGHAWAAGERPCDSSQLEIQVGSCRKQALVFGDRHWRLGLTGRSPSRPEPFIKIPIRYEHCFGGAVVAASGVNKRAIAHNPVGVGIFRDNGAEARLPNFEDPQALLRSVDDRPLPMGIGPVCRGWMPRLRFGGTYDSRWVETRAPLWPLDFDERFFCAAPPGLCAIPHLRGGELVHLVGVSPGGAITFCLPTDGLQAKFKCDGRVVRQAMLLDGVLLEPDDSVLTLIWRAHREAHGELLNHEPVTVRRFHNWECARV